MEFLLTFEQGNGYRCNCCRTTYRYNEVRAFETEEEAQRFVQLINESFNKNDDAHDLKIVGAYKIEKVLYEE
jgi:hypothetical protein